MAPKPSDKGRPRTKPTDAKGRIRRGKPKVCVFCAEHIPWVDYKDPNLLRRFMSDRGKIKSRSNSGTCAQHQREVAKAIKVARELALLPYAVRTFAGDKSGARRGRGPGGPGGARPAAAGGPDDRAASPSDEAVGIDDVSDLSGDIQTDQPVESETSIV